MAARKLQTEIDRTLKKVAEGVEVFESNYDKLQASTNQTQKEKLETELKTQIKKLQRLRDQIKTWVASNDIKDKSSLLDNRRLIETQMEKFKACEKEMKTKAFSKEGLIASAKIDPKVIEQEETMAWVQEKVEALQQQVELTEAEIEALQGGGKKKKASSAAERLEQLEHLNERRRWHISRLEIILRLLDNGSLKADKIKLLTEDVSYFVESNAEDEFDEDEGIYDEFNLDEQEELWGINAENDDGTAADSEVEAEEAPQRTPSKKHEEERDTHRREKEPPTSPVLKKAGVTMHPRKTSTAAENKPPPNLNFSATPMSSVVKSGLPSATRAPPQLPPIRYAAAAAAAVSSPAASATSHSAAQLAVTTPPSSGAAYPPPVPPAPSLPSSVPVEPSVSGTSVTHDPLSSPSMTHPSVTSPMMSTTSAPLDGSMYSARESPALSEAVPVSLSPLRAVPHEAPQSSQPAPALNGHAHTAATAPLLPPGMLSVDAAHAMSQAASSKHAFPPGVKVPAQEAASAVPFQTAIGTQRPPSTSSQQPSAPQQRVPSTLSDLVTSMEEVKKKAAHRMANLDQVNKMLDSGRTSAPQPQDTNRPNYYVPRNPWQTPSYYPQSVIPVLESSTIFSQLEVETLFYIFYYQPGTYKQFLAAKELKKQSWRFHVKYMTWFQRHSEPQAITDEYEQGVYVYFDWEGSWCQRKKADFRFEYRYLSED